MGTNDPHWHTRRPEHNIPTIDRFIQAVALMRGSTVLDMGGGKGPVTTKLAKKYDFNVLDVDPDDRMLYEAEQAIRFTNAEERKAWRGNALMMQGDAGHPNVPDSSVDCILIANAAHWIKEDKNTKLSDSLAALRKVLKPGGSLAVIYTILDQESELTKNLHNIFLDTCPHYKDWTTSLLRTGERDIGRIASHFIKNDKCVEDKWVIKVSRDDLWNILTSYTFFPHDDEKKQQEIKVRVDQLFGDETFLDLGMQTTVRYGTEMVVEKKPDEVMTLARYDPDFAARQLGAEQRMGADAMPVASLKVKV